MKELFDFIQDSYDPKYSTETENVESNVQPNTSADNTTEQQNITTEQTSDPFIKIRPASNQKKSGTTTETKDKTVDLYKVNNDYLLDYGNKLNDQYVNYANLIFTNTGTNPTLNGKPVDVAEIGELMKDPANRQAILEQAQKLEDDPNIDPEVVWNAHEMRLNAFAIESAIPLIQKKMNEQMYQSALMVDANLKSRGKNPKGTNLNTTVERGMGLGWLTILGAGTSTERDDYHDVNATELFDKDGKLLNQQEFNLLYLQKKVDAYNSLVGSLSKESGGAKSAITNYNQAAYTDVNGVRHVMNYNKMNEARYTDQQEELNELSKRLEMAKQYKAAGLESELDPQNTYESLMKNGLPSNWRQTAITKVSKISNATSYANTMGGEVSFEALPKLTSKNYKQVVSKMQNNLNKLGYTDYAKNASFQRSEKVYNVLKNNIIERYNKSDNAAVYKIKADLENKFKDNKGGVVESPGGEFDFNWATPFLDKNKKKSGGLNPAIKELTTIMNYALHDDGSVIYSFGPVRSDKTGNYLVPDKNNDVGDDVKTVINSIADDIRLAEPDMIKGKKGSVMLPQGKVTFTRKCFDKDGKEYHAFNIDFNSNYFNQHKYKGTKDNPGISVSHPELVTKGQGITIFVPADVSEKSSTTAIETKKASMIGPAESMITTAQMLNSNKPTTIPIDFKDAGRITLTTDPSKRQITIGGFHVAYNVDNGNYDTIRVNPTIFQEDQFTDIDRAVNNQIDILHGKFITNNFIKRRLLELKGVKDPSKLK